MYVQFARGLENFRCKQSYLYRYHYSQRDQYIDDNQSIVEILHPRYS